MQDKKKSNESEVDNFDLYDFYDLITFMTIKSSDMAYIVPAGTKIGHVHLKVADLERSLKFYRDLLGFELQQMFGNSAAFISAGDYHHHIGLNTWQSKNGPPAPLHAAGLYHTAILYPERKDLAIVLKRLIDAKYPLSGASDHGVSEAIYLDDPDKNGVELYWDRPKERWPRDNDGNLLMITEALDIEDLLRSAG
jgi:catechol 2,3-dioxygenase